MESKICKLYDTNAKKTKSVDGHDKGELLTAALQRSGSKRTLQ